VATSFQTNNLIVVLNPRFKMRYFERKLPQMVSRARSVFLDAVSYIYSIIIHSDHS
jgi:hypothetical protein